MVPRRFRTIAVKTWWTVLLLLTLSEGAVSQPASVRILPLSESADAAFFQPSPGVRRSLKLNQPNDVSVTGVETKTAHVVFVKEGYLDCLVPYDEQFLKTGFPGSFEKLERDYRLELPVTPADVKVFETGISTDKVSQGHYLGLSGERPTLDRSRFYDASRGVFFDVNLRLEKSGYQPLSLSVSAKELTKGKVWEPVQLLPEPGLSAWWARTKAGGMPAGFWGLLVLGLGGGAFMLVKRRPRLPVSAVSPVLESEVGRYRLLESVGKGGTSEVFRATSLDDPGRLPVALKIMHQEVQDEASRDRFLREIKASLGLSHPGLARVYDWGEHSDGRIYMVCELLEGQTLRARLKSRGPLEEADVARLASDLGGALSHLHEHGLIHRDVKPDNIFLTKDGVTKLVDLGLARGQVDVLTNTGIVLGTPHYMPPEQINGKPVLGSDQYALGITVFECLTGKRPYDGTLVELINQQVSAPVPRLRDFLPTASEYLESVLARILAKRAEHRYPNLAEAVAELVAALDEQDGELDTAAFARPSS